MRRRSGVWRAVWILGAASAVYACGRSQGDDGASEPNGANAGGESSDAGQASTRSDAGSSEGGKTAEAGAPPVPHDGGWGNDGGAPSPPECEPGPTACDGPLVRTCQDGVWVIESTCSASEVCVDGACHAIECVPGSLFCLDDQIRLCGAEATSSIVVATCDADQYCVSSNGEAECSDRACEPGTPICLDDVATTCKADGSGPKPQGQACGAGKVCRDGACVGSTCKTGEKVCEHGDVYFCVEGEQPLLFSDCSDSEVCDPDLLSCRQRICEPGKLYCDTTRVVSCNDIGTGYEPPAADCASSGQVCVNGSCKTQTCTPNTSFCNDGNVYGCDATGTISSLSQTCNPANYHCVTYAYGAYCGSNYCNPGSPMCNGNDLTTCASDGSGAAAGGTSCGNDVCSNGACQPRACPQNYSYFCKDGDIHWCSDGLYTYKDTECGADARCVQDGANRPSCQPYNCTPGLKACLANQVGVCNDDGTALQTIKANCATADQVCDTKSTCANSAVDTIGSAEDLLSVANGYVFGDIIRVHSNRELTRIDAPLVLAGERDLRWLVYEYVIDSYVAKFDILSKGETGSGTFSSGTIDFTLVAGRTYLIGVAVSGGAAVPYVEPAPWSQAISFGTVTSSFMYTYAPAIYAYNGVSNQRVFQLKLTSALP